MESAAVEERAPKREHAPGADQDVAMDTVSIGGEGDEALQNASLLTTADAPALIEEPSAPRVRPKIDRTVAKKGRSMFGVLLGTLNKAKVEDKQRSASEAAKKRAQIEQRLASKRQKETSSVRQAEEAKRDRSAAHRKEDEIALRDATVRGRVARLPRLANFLITSDVVPRSATADELDAVAIANALLGGPPRSHPPPIFYRPAILTAAQKAFIEVRKVEVERTVKAEWTAWVSERAQGVAEAAALRAKAEAVAAEQRAQNAEDEPIATDAKAADVKMDEDETKAVPEED